MGTIPPSGIAEHASVAPSTNQGTEGHRSNCMIVGEPSRGATIWKGRMRTILPFGIAEEPQGADGPLALYLPTQ